MKIPFSNNRQKGEEKSYTTPGRKMGGFSLSLRAFLGIRRNRFAAYLLVTILSAWIISGPLFFKSFVQYLIPRQAHAAWYSTGGTWKYRKALHINHLKVPNTDQANFPVLVTLTDANLKTVTNGGHVQSANGYDIIFIAADGSTKLDHEIEKYDGTTGTLVAWVRIPSLSSTTDTNLYMYFGNLAATDSQNKTGVWNENGANNFKAVWHLGEAGTNPTVNDSTSNANNSSTQAWTSGTGMIGGGGVFNGSSQYIDVGSGSSLNFDASGSFSAGAWIKSSFSSGSANDIIVNSWIASGANPGWTFYTEGAAGKLKFYASRGANLGYFIGSRVVADNTWHYVSMTYNNQTVTFYVDGVYDASGSLSSNIGSGAMNTSGYKSLLGANYNTSNNNFTNYINGSIDEVRVSSVARSADWIKAEYNNVSSPSTFITADAEEAPFSSTFAAWDYRKSVTVTNANASNLTGYQVKLAIDTKSIYDAGQMQINCADLRFAETDGTNIPYWIESGCDTANTIVWIKTNLPASSAKNVYMYHGNSGASAVSSGTDVFLKFSDANDAASWRGNTVTKVGNELHTTGSGYWISTLPISVSYPWVIETRARHTNAVSNSNIYFVIGNGSGSAVATTRNMQAYADANSTVYNAYLNGAGSVPIYNSYALNTDYIHQFTERSPGHYDYYVYNTGRTLLGSALDKTYTVSGNVDPVTSFQVASGSPSYSGDVYLSWVFARKYAAAEPTYVLSASELGAARMSYLTVTGTSGTLTAGGSEVLTVTAIGSDGATFTGYTGSKTLIFSGAGVSPGSNPPTCTNSSSADKVFGQGTVLDFSSGQATCILKLYSAETSIINATNQTDGYNAAGHTFSVNVSAAAFGTLNVIAPSSVYNGTAFNMSLIPQDTYGNMTTSGISSTTSITAGSGTISPGVLGGMDSQKYLGPDGQQYAHEKDIKITNSLTAAITDYQVKLTLNTSGVSQTGTCNDIRFATSVNANIPYWIESGCGTANTTVWIKTTLPANSDTTVYWYYGNNSVASAAAGRDVFLKFSDASDASSWSNALKVGNELHVSLPVSAVSTLPMTLSYPWVIETNLRRVASSSSNLYVLIGDGSGSSPATNRNMEAYSDLNTTTYNGYYSGHELPLYSSYAIGTNYIHKFVEIAPSNYKHYLYDASRNLLGSASAPSFASVGDMNPITSFQLGSWNGTSDIYVSWVLAHKYASAEPVPTVQSTGTSPYGSYGGFFTITNASIGTDTLTLTNGSVTKTYNLNVAQSSTGNGTGNNSVINVTQIVTSEITISAPANVIMSPAIAGMTGGTANGSATWTVKTNNAAGFIMKIKASTSPALTASGGSFADYTQASTGIPDFSWSIDNAASEFGYTVEPSIVADTTTLFKDDGNNCNTGSLNTTDKCWAAFNTTDATILNRSTTTTSAGEDAIVKLRAQSGPSHHQIQGDYQATVTVTALAN
jgi:hypothetical protein